LALGVLELEDREDFEDREDEDFDEDFVIFDLEEEEEPEPERYLALDLYPEDELLLEYFLIFFASPDFSDVPYLYDLAGVYDLC
jgi:hypothetical protein